MSHSSVTILVREGDDVCCDNSVLLLIGSDFLRLSRKDLMDICGPADGIRLFNALHSQ